MKIVLLIERPDGSTYEQPVTVKQDDTVEDTLKKQQRMLGKDYWICDHYVEEDKSE